MKIIPIKTAENYSIYIEHDLLNSPLLIDYCHLLNKRLVIITDNHLQTLALQLKNNLQKKKLSAEIFSFPAGENFKTREVKQLLEDQLLAKQYGRDTLLIALGGGVVLDMVGFLGSTYCRGVPVIYIPTTLLAMVDASIGGKTGVNTSYGKNLIGTFNQPKMVIIDTKTLCTLPTREFINGTVEMIKHGVIADQQLFKNLQLNYHRLNTHHPTFLTDMIVASINIKKNIVEKDEKEYGMRQILNFGHTIGHAIETIENYHISHGQAVAIGMLVESYLSIKCGYLPEKIFKPLHQLFVNYGISLRTNAFKNVETMQDLLQLDKKAINKQANFVLLDDIGHPHVNDKKYAHPIDAPLLKNTIRWAANYFDENF